jgi:hypothetical protein
MSEINRSGREEGFDREQYPDPLSLSKQDFVDFWTEKLTGLHKGEWIDKLEKAVSLAYADKSWSDEQREANVFFVLRNNDLTTVNENLAKLEKRVKKLEPPQLTDEAIIRAYTN